MVWFMDRINKGYFELSNPYSRQTSRLVATPDQIHTIVLWSKNFGPFLEHGYDRDLSTRGYHLFFNFTINSPNPALEPIMPPLADRLDQLSRLTEKFGPQAIQWRFDPICHYQLPSGEKGDNLDQFAMIAAHAAKAGVSICVTSFADHYRKVLRRTSAAGIRMLDPPMAQKVEQILSMARHLAPLNIQLHLCCEKAILDALPDKKNIQSAACIPNHRLALLYGADISFAKDGGQRAAAGCGCKISKDIGNYQTHPCRHNCLYCYANPVPAQTDR